MVNELSAIFSRFTVESAIDVLLVALVFFGLMRLFRGTAAVQLLRGFLVIILTVVLVAQMVQLTGFTWLVSNSLSLILISIPIIFQPELRRALERLGRTAPLFNRPAQVAKPERLVTELVRTAEMLAQQKHGALIVLAATTGLDEYIETGTLLDADVSSELLLTVFFPNTALHDGAVIVRGARVVCAGTILPLTQRQLADSQMGTRHRAALGITEQSDALAIVVSEETGIISVARYGRIVRRLDEKRLRKILQAFYEPGRSKDHAK